MIQAAGVVQTVAAGMNNVIFNWTQAAVQAMIQMNRNKVDRYAD